MYILFYFLFGRGGDRKTYHQPWGQTQLNYHRWTRHICGEGCLKHLCLPNLKHDHALEMHKKTQLFMRWCKWLVPVRDLKKRECVSLTERLSTTTRVRSPNAMPRRATRANRAKTFMGWVVMKNFPQHHKVATRARATLRRPNFWPDFFLRGPTCQRLCS